jgi:MoxR-like ATPase
VLLIDEIDRADEAFEAFLLEVLADYQITVPELGTLRARHVPHVVLTSNGTRELSDALRRRCLYHYLDYPTLAREIAIVAGAARGGPALVEEAVAFVQRLRREDLAKTPGVAETLDWVRALHRLHCQALPDDMAVLLDHAGLPAQDARRPLCPRPRPRAPAARRPAQRGRGRKNACPGAGKPCDPAHRRPAPFRNGWRGFAPWLREHG